MLISHRLKFNFVFAIILSASHGKLTELPEQGLSKGWRNLVLRGQSKGWRNQSSGRTTTVVAINMSHFDSVLMGPLEPILEVYEAFRADTDALKLNLAVRSYRIEELEPYVLGVVKKYPHIEGLTAFNKITAELFLGTDPPVIQQKRVARVQSLSGSGSFCLASAFIRRYFPDAQAMISSPTWVSRKNIFDDVGVPSLEYRYYEPKTVSLDFDGMISDIKIMLKDEIRAFIFWNIFQ